MPTGLRRFTITIPPNLDFDLRSVKDEVYNRQTQNSMFKDLIKRGLEVSNFEKKKAQI